MTNEKTNAERARECLQLAGTGHGPAATTAAQRGTGYALLAILEHLQAAVPALDMEASMLQQAVPVGIPWDIDANQPLPRVKITACGHEGDDHTGLVGTISSSGKIIEVSRTDNGIPHPLVLWGGVHVTEPVSE